MNKDKNNLGQGSIPSLVIKLSIPAIAAQIINLLYNIVDRMYIGHIPQIGKTALTGVGVTFPIIMLISAFSGLVGMGGAPQAAIKMGKNDYSYAEKILGTCFGTIIAISFILTTTILLFKNPILMLFGGSENTIAYAVDYITIYALGTIFVQTVLGLNPFITCQGFASVGMATTLIGAVLNIILDPIFIYLLNMGVKGAALATVISQAVSCIWVLKFLTGKKTSLKIKKTNIVPDIKIAIGVMSLGISPFIMQSTESLITVCFNSSLQSYGGDIAVGAMTILSSLMQFSNLPVIGLAQGCQPIISFNFGAGKNDRVKRTFRILLICSFLFTMFIWSCAIFVPQVLISFFTSDMQFIETSKWALRIYMASTGLFGIQLACQQTFISLGQAKISVFLAVLRKIILLVPLIFILPRIIPTSLAESLTPPEIQNLFTYPSKVFSVFLAEPIADFGAVLCTLIMFKINFKKILNRGVK